MFTTEGFWISPDGEVLPVIEHIVTVMADPRRFGVDPDDKRIKAYQRGVVGAREAILTEVLERGWVRVRGARSGRSITAVFETWRWYGDQKDNVIFSLRKLGLHDEDNVELHELATKKGHRTTPEQLRAEGIPLGGFRLERHRYPGLGAWLRDH